MKRVYIGLLCFFAVAATTLSVMATPASRHDIRTKTCRVLNQGPLEWESRPWGEGGRVFKEFCRSCHSRENAEAKGATFLWEESKTSRGWNMVFARMRAKCARDGSWKGLTEDQVLMVNDYLYRWSSDSMDINDSA